MLIHRAVQAIYGDNERLHAVTIIKMNDHQHVTNPNLSHEDLIEASANILPIFQPPEGVDINQLARGHPVGMRADPLQIPMMTNAMAQNRCFNSASRVFRSVLALTVNVISNTHGPIIISEIEYNLICDVYPQ